MKPVVGITTSVEEVRAGAWTFAAVNSPDTYVRAVQRAGGAAVLLVADPDDPSPGPVLDRLDALLVAGGAGDVDPALYGEERRRETVPDAPGRDAFEAGLVREAAGRGTPVLAVCRGMQLLCAVHGGRLHQHLPDAVGHDGHRSLPSGFAWHDVALEPGSLAARVAGGERARVASHHHQGVADPGSLAVTGRAPEDGVIEAVEDPALPFMLGVLWHPEEDERSPVVPALVQAARG